MNCPLNSDNQRNARNNDVEVTGSARVPEKKPKRSVAAAAPAAPADDTPLPSLKIYSRCGTSAGTHTAATRDGRGRELSLQKSRTENRSTFQYATCSVFLQLILQHF